MIFFAQKAFIIDKGNLLMVQKSALDPVQPDKWEVPGGRMEEGEEIDAHIEREVFEETGFNIIPNKPFYVWKWTIPSKADKTRTDTVIAVARLAALRSGSLSIENQVADDFLSQIKWIPLSQIAEMDIIPNMQAVMAEFVRIVNAESIK